MTEQLWIVNHLLSQQYFHLFWAHDSKSCVVNDDVCTLICWYFIVKDYSIPGNIMNRGEFWGLMTHMLCYTWTFPVKRKECFKWNNETHSWHPRLLANATLSCYFICRTSLESCSKPVPGVFFKQWTQSRVSQNQKVNNCLRSHKYVIWHNENPE